MTATLVCDCCQRADCEIDPDSGLCLYCQPCPKCGQFGTFSNPHPLGVTCSNCGFLDTT